MELVPTKASINRYSAVNYPPQEVYAQLERAARSAIEHLNEIPVPEIPENIEMTLQLMCPNQARSFAIAGNEQIDERTLLISGRSATVMHLEYTTALTEFHQTGFCRTRLPKMRSGNLPPNIDNCTCINAQ